MSIKLNMIRRLFIFMMICVPLCCRQLKDPCLSKDPQIFDLCEQGINNNLWFSFDIFKTNWL